MTTYVAEAGYDDEELAHALASVTGGNPFFLIEALRHVDESGGVWDQSTLPQGVREAVSRRLSRLPAETNKALAAAAVVGSRFALDLVESVVGSDLIDAFDEACQAGIVIEEPGGNYRFNHAIVRQSLLAELASVRRMRLHQRIATTLETQPGADDELLAELAHHYFECAWAGNAAKAVFYCRRAADQAMTRLAYEGAADLYHQALHALEELDDELPDRDDLTAELLIARCEALLAAGDVASAAGAVSQLQETTVDSARLAAWATCFDGQLSMLIHPERLDEAESALSAAAAKLAQLDDAAGKAKAHTVRAGCLARLGRIADCEIALDDALTAARRARESRSVNAVLAGAPLAALWGPNPVPRAGGRCLDVVRLLRITTDSPAVEATSTRCQAVLEAFRGRAAASRRMIDSARRTVTELGLRHARLEVEQFAGIVELIVDDPAAAESHLRKAYNGFRRMGLDADTAETAALLGRSCLALGRDAEAEELCTESERLAGHALKASMGWRTLRAHLLSRGGDHAAARSVAEAAVALAERTDALVDHGDACLTLATVLAAAGNTAGSRVAAEQAVSLYERKGAAALAEMAQRLLSERTLAVAPAPPATSPVVPDTECVRVGERVMAAIHREDWDEFERLFAPDVSIESRRKIVGFTLPSVAARREIWRGVETGTMRIDHVMVAARGERLALSRLVTSTADTSPGAPQDELLQLFAIDDNGQVVRQVWFDVDDIDAAMTELDAAHARFEEEYLDVRRLENTAAFVFEHVWSYMATCDWDAMAQTVADDYIGIDHRRVVSAETQYSRDVVIRDLQAAAEVGFTISMVTAVAIRGERLVLARTRASGNDPAAVQNDALNVVEIDTDDRIATVVTYDLEDFDAAMAELESRYLAGEASAHADTWSLLFRGFAAFNEHQLPASTPDWVTIDHRRGRAFSPGELVPYIHATWELAPQARIYVETVHRLNNLGALVTQTTHGRLPDGFDAEWLEVTLLTVEGDLINRCEIFDEADLDSAIARFDQLSGPSRRLENTATLVFDRLWTHYAARDWDAVAETLAENVSGMDHRRVVNAGTRRGRDAVFDDLQVSADLFTISMVDVIAVRGERLALARVRASGRDPEAIQNDALNVVEIDADERITTVEIFDLDDMDAAFTDLDARYLTGEAAPYARMWTATTENYAALSRHELPPMTPDAVTLDHRRAAAFAPGEFLQYLRAAIDQSQSTNIHPTVVHRLNELGTVITHTAYVTSSDGFDAEFQDVIVSTLAGNVVNHFELFDEADLDSALARFEQLQSQVRPLENSASRAAERFLAHFAARDWATVAETFADDFSSDDRRRVVGAGVRHGRDAQVADLRSIADVGITHVTSAPVATRGERLVLTRGRLSAGHQGSETFFTESFSIVEVNAEGRIVALVSFDLEDVDAAFAELDSRYLAGEAAAHARTWSAITEGYAALSRHELPTVTPDCVSIDHRRAAAFAPGDLSQYIRAVIDESQSTSIFVSTAHHLSELGAVVTHSAYGTSRQGFDAEWHEVALLTVVGNAISRCELFDETDLDAALAQFEELHPPARRLENTVSRATGRYLERVVAHDWDAVAEALADDYVTDDRRHVTGGGIFGRDAEIASVQVQADLGVTAIVPTVIAVRGERLALALARYSGRGQEHETFEAEMLIVFEMNAADRFTAAVAFDSDDIDAAFEELDARYLAGEAAAHAQTWSIVAASYAALNRHQLPLTAPDCVNIDHRRETAFGPADVTAYFDAGWDVEQDINVYVEQVHRLSDVGAVVTYAAHETSQEGLNAEWRGIAVFTVEDDMINRTEVFDEADLDAALTKFVELQPNPRRLVNAASHVYERFLRCFDTRDWDAINTIVAEDMCHDDRRRIVSAGVRLGRDAQVEDMRVLADMGMHGTSDVIAIRGERLVLSHIHGSNVDVQSQTFLIDVIDVVEIDSDGRMIAVVTFDPDDVDNAFAELDARYLADEAEPHADAWSVISAGYASMNRHELFPTTPGWVNIDHRRPGIIEEGGLNASLLSLWKLVPDVTFRATAVHRLSDLGAVCSHVAHGVSQDGVDAEWRGIEVMAVDGDLINRCEIFDEADLDAALGRFEELQPPMPQLENLASRVAEQFLAHFAGGSWNAMTQLLAVDTTSDDRRRVVNAGIRHGRDVEIANWRATADVWSTDVRSTVVATRGDRLALIRLVLAGPGQPSEAFNVTALAIVEINADNQIAATVVIEPDDTDAAFAELDARYLSGEAAAHARTWSAITACFAALNRREPLPTTPDFVSIDHRQTVAFDSGELIAFVRAGSDLDEDITRVESVSHLNNFGAAVTFTTHGTSREGFDAEWRAIAVSTVDGDLVNRCELFDDTDLDGALARLKELHQPAPQLENAAIHVRDRFLASFLARDWDAIRVMLADDHYSDDRRRVIGAGIRRGRDVQMDELRAVTAEFGTVTMTSVVIATRGERLALCRGSYMGRDQRPGAYQIDALTITEINADEQIAAVVMFDPDDIDTAFAELDARYLAGEAAVHAHTWSLITQVYASLNGGELPPVTPDLVDIDHRPLAAIGSGDLTAYVAASLEDMAINRIYVEAVHRLGDLGAVVSHAADGISHEGFDAEWRTVQLLTFEGDRISRCEIFDEADLDAALARFEELQPQTPRLETAATRVYEQLLVDYTARDWAAITGILSDDLFSDDRRPLVGAGIRPGPDALVEDLRATAAVEVTNATSDTIATRGSRLALTRARYSRSSDGPEAFHVDFLQLVEIDATARITALIAFAPEELDGAFTELESRYVAGEAAARAQTWWVIANAYTGFARHELPPMTTDSVYIDRRSVVSIEGVELAASMRVVWDLIPDAVAYIETVHRLSELGAVITQVLVGTSHEGFDAEARMIAVFTIEGDLFNCFEIFDEADLDAALARFDELHPQARRLENAATQVAKRFPVYMTASDWDGMTEILAADISIDDRRPGANAGIRRGRKTAIQDMRAAVDVGFKNMTSTAIATRGEHLALMLVHASGPAAQDPDAYQLDIYHVVEIDTDGRTVAVVVFDFDDIDAAFAELDARYLAGEAAAHTHTWSAIAQAFDALNRNEIPPTTGEFEDVDHRLLAAVGPGDLKAYLGAALKDAPQTRIYVEAVHQLTDLGAVVTHVAKGTSRDGFDAEWRITDIFTVEDDLLSRCEMFDESDLDAALARFDELTRPAPLLENDATRVWTPLIDAFNRRDTDGLLALGTADGRFEDRRKGLRDVVEGPERRKAVQAVMETAPSGWRLEVEPIAVRGSRLSLTRACYRDVDAADRPIAVELLHVTELGDGGLLHDTLNFDSEDIDGAFAELEARYLAGEATAHSRTWSAILRVFEVLNRGELPTATQDFEDVDHRRGAMLAPGDLMKYLAAARDDLVSSRVYPLSVHRLTDRGAVVTHTGQATSREGFYAEWRITDVFMVDGDLINRCEMFDESDLDAALARFDELDSELSNRRHSP
ncbi:hypothetical protein NJB14197_00340 [Mycobacterium montefiorense]|uniref:SnoaL-like domain-containing protein n=1 Tax=Mycobacterium montefiorense TaxID=154654 RepID=A0AA37USP4_9MYCO|nr:hypothetical protein MmonteBS_18020 [Mycobacterium montefiorense]GKU36623.1 hypothetical protein NJB14191_39690 [Mycobacterium montefiorense]GKU42191.1 hypothetical protein NJB14192_41740 [Mycobacterium montefiorense]GKU45882.1 hypothetical protein NJB14194_25030 [Mycobacterium montefiorense]GKU53873.1 hypothetical protein NJB14195_51140 [Mycobacterium montefiorense]